MIELLGALAAIDHLALRLRGRRAILLVDSELVESALIIGGSNKEDMNELVTIFWDVVLRNDTCLFITRVPTDSNPADGPSRGFFTELELRGGKWETMSPSDKVLSIKARDENLLIHACGVDLVDWRLHRELRAPSAGQSRGFVARSAENVASESDSCRHHLPLQGFGRASRKRVVFSYPAWNEV